MTDTAGVVPLRLRPAASATWAPVSDIPLSRDRAARDLKAMFKVRYPAVSQGSPVRLPWHPEQPAFPAESTITSVPPSVKQAQHNATSAGNTRGPAKLSAPAHQGCFFVTVP
jgi:hypothetical protein